MPTPKVPHFAAIGLAAVIAAFACGEFRQTDGSAGPQPPGDRQDDGGASDAAVVAEAGGETTTDAATPPPDGPCDLTSDGSAANTQSLIDAASDGNIVCVPAGTFTWDKTVGWTSKNIFVRGAGIDKTTITRNGPYSFYVGVADATKGHFRISGFTFTGTTTQAVVAYSSEGLVSKASGLFRVDHNKFLYTSDERTGVDLRGVAYGLIDHNLFTWHFGFAVHIAAFNASDACTAEKPSGNWINSQPLDLGTANAVYIEDNTITSTGVPAAAYDTSAGGGRAVFRHNTVTGGFYYSHWTRGCEIGGILHEIYNNAWIGNADYGIATGAGYPIRLEAGTGVIFNNYATSFNTAGSTTPYVFVDDRRAGGSGGEPLAPLLPCDGSHPWDGNIEANGWPCLGQIGRGPGKSLAELIAGEQQPSVPLYLWNNGVESSCATGNACKDSWTVYADPASHIKATPHSNGEVDYLLNGATPKPGYAPYTYPHPLVTTPWP